MLRISFERHCVPADSFVREDSSLFTAGTAEGFSVALVTHGRCHVGSADSEADVALAATGCFILWAGALVFEPQGECQMEGVVLAGDAADEVAAQLAQPLLLRSEACPGAEGLLFQLMESGDARPLTQGSALAYSLLCVLAGAHSDVAPLPPLVGAGMVLIREHFAEVYGVEELAGELGVSKSHLIRSFTAAVGTTPGQYLTDVRIEAAKRLLLHREYSLDIVASLCGFSGANYLCKVFRRATGQPPAAWRRAALARTQILPGAEEQLQEWEEQLYL